MNQRVQKTIEINAKVKTSLENMSKTIQQLEDGLSKQKFDLGKTSGLSKLIKDYKEAKTELDELMQGDQIARADIKKAENLGDKVSKLYKKIATSFKELQGGNEEVFKNLFPSKFVTQITKGTQAIDKFFQKLDAKGIKNTKVTDLTKEVQTLETELNQLKNRRIKAEIDVDKEKVSKELQRINNEFDNMRQNFKKKLFPDEGKDSKGRTTTQKLDSSVATWSNRLTQDREARKNLKVADLTKAQKTQITKLEGQLTDSAGSSLIESERKRLQALQAEQRKRETIAKTPGARDTSRSRREYGGVADKELSAQIAASEKELQRLKAIADKIEDIKQQPQKAYDAAVKNLETRIKTDRTNLEKAEKALADHQSRREEEEKIATQKTEDFMSGKSTAEATQEEIEALKKLNQERQEAIDLEKKLKQEEGFKSQESKDSAISKKESAIANKRREIEALNNEIKNLTNETNLDEFFQKLKELGVNTEGIEHTHEGLEQIRKDLKDLNAQTTEAIRKQLLELGYDSQEADKMVDALGKGMEELGDKDKDLSRAENEMENLKNQVLQFFSITNSVQLFKRAVMSALNTVKELDATMTEAAVVTDFSVGDMWDKLPEYSANAQKLGVSINGMYQATTLYYQQGLKSNEAMALGIETMKMARIAGMESAEATEAMTAALRGFNMELNEVSATRVNDVYSQLAAVTAADTEQIATAMSKTASIAASANMEFETTAALLAQIIETTQEAPETAGTALKTIIARFSEVKSLQDEGKATGTDAEGEAIDVNKIQTALKTVGISMDGFFQGTEGLDSILLKLAEKWNTLDFQTQHYIATMAAGSRQQSRFIAMMSDYERTTELVGEAQDSAGASQRQFNKTQDSMESKLQRLENAWNEFLMGLTNNEILKGAVDFLTLLIEGVNNLTASLSGGNGLVKSFISLITVIGALKLGKNALGNLFGWTGKQIGLGQGQINKPTSETGAAGSQPGVISNPAGSGAKAGQSWGVNFIASAVKKIDGGKHSIQKAADNLAPTSRKVDKTQPSEKKKDTTQPKEQKIDTPTSQTSQASQGQDPWDDYTDGANTATVATQQAGNAAQEAGEKVSQAGNDTAVAGEKMQETGDKTEEAGTKTSTFASRMQIAGGAALAVGGALTLLGSYLDSIGMEEGAEAVTMIGTGFTILGTVLMGLPPIIEFVKTIAVKAGIEVQAAWWPLILIGLAIVAVIAAIVVIVTALAKGLEAANDSAQLEKMNEQLSNLSAAADEAKQKLEDMASAKEDLEDMQSAFKGLVKGSREWKQALIENNQKVLELINTYPQLAEYVSKGINGELTISEEGWNEAMDQQQEAYTHTLGAKTAMAQQVQEKEQSIKTEETMNKVTGNSVRMDYAEFAEDGWGKTAMIGGATAMGAAIGTMIAPGIGSAIGAGIGAIVGTVQAVTAKSPEEIEREQTGGLTYDEFNEFGALAAERGLSLSDGSSKEEFKDLYLEMGYDEASFESVWSSMQNMGASFDELANSAMAVSMAEQARADSIAASVAQTSAIVQDSEKFGVVAEEMGAQAFTKYDDKVAAKADSYLEDMDVQDKNLDEGAAAEAITKYAKIQNISEAEVRRQIENEEITKEDIANIIAAQDVNEEMKDAMEGTVKVLERISKGKSDREMAKIKGLMTDRGLGMGIGDISAMSGKTKEEMSAYLTSQGFSEADAKAMGYETMDAFVQAMYKNAQNASTAYENAFNDLNTYGMGETFKGQIESLNASLIQLGSTTGLTVEQTQSLANAMAKVTANGGQTSELLSQFPQLLAGLSGQNLDAAISMLSATDWSTTAGIDSTIEALKSLGVNIDEQLVDKIYLASRAVKKLDFEKLENELSNLSQLKKSIKDKDGAKTFTKEEKNALLASGFGEGQFVRTDVDEYTFMGETNELLSAIETYTSKILGEMRGDLEESVAKGQKFEDYFSRGTKVTIYTGEDKIKSQIDAEVAIQRMIAGTLDTLHMGTRNNIYRDDLISMIRTLGILDHVEGWDKAEEEGGYTDAGMMEAVKSAYLEYYGYGGETYRQKKKQGEEEGAELKEYEYSEAVGTDRFWEMEAELEDKRKRLINLSMSSVGHEFSRRELANVYLEDTDFGKYFVTNTNKGGDTGLKFLYDPTKLYDAVLNEEGFVENYQGSPLVKEALADLANQLDIEGASSMNFAQLYEALKAYNDELNRGELAQDAYIQKHAGLDIAYQQAAADLEKGNSALYENSKLINSQIIRTHKANKVMKAFLSVLDDQVDAFQNCSKRSEEYQEALSKITTSAKEVFGEHIGSDFVEDYKNLFIQMSKGGQEAEKAYAQLGKKAAMLYLESLGDSLGRDADTAFTEIVNALPPNLEIGVTADISEAINNLLKAGYAVEDLKATISALGFSVNFVPQTFTFDKNTNTIVGQGDLTHSGGGSNPNYYTEQRLVSATVQKKPSSYGVGKSGGGGGAGKSDYENPYDRLHNTYQKINDLLRERENLERRYQRLIDHNLATAEKMAEISKRNIQNQKEEIEKQKEIIAVRKAEVEAEIGANIGMSDYVYTETDELGNQSIRINWENISAITDDKEEERVKDFYDKIAEKLESIYEAQNALLDAEDAIWEELQQGKDEYLDLERQVKDAIINQRQKEIDELTTINDSITETNSSLLESIQNQIDQYRQNRDNEKTEEEIADKQRRLAYLQQDTSGANALEILNLQKEIEESQESYTDQLIDQKITELQKQNDQAAEQRQQQIDIMQAQLEQYSQSNQIWDEVSKIIDQGTSEIGGLVKGSELESLLKTADAFEGMSKIQKMDWLNQINNQIASALVWMGQGAYTTLAEGGKVSFVNKDGKTVTGIVNDRGEVEVETDVGKAIYTDIVMDAYGNLRSSQSEADAIDEANRQALENENIEAETDQVATNLYGVKPSDATSQDRKEGIYVQALQAALNQMGYNAGAIDGKFGTNTKNALKAFQQSAAMKEKYPNYSAYGTWDDKTNDVLRMVGYKTGGLADFTGPAWLDGTKSRPEYVLNAGQTKAFFTLVDVLSSLQTKDSKETQNNGDKTYDIDINVESISSDYDVEQLANTIKRLINEDAHYRNNNTINLMR